MIDPFLNLAFSVFSSKGVYALLLGSGISRASGIPTGWEIVEDLIRKLAHLGGEAPSDLAAWYRSRHNADPDYSQILAQLAASPAERLKLLQAYFEPTEDERREGRKLPTTAHRAIAELVAKGYIRVIVTTNFDRLLEQALTDVGVQPSIISNADAALGAMPLVHSRCTLVKVNGDYLDARFRNIEEELKQYEPAIDRLLDQVFDEYGLIVCGWSADWDSALRKAIERCPSRRFTAFWTSRGKTSQLADRLIAQRGVVRLSIGSADDFFFDVKERVLALEALGANDPLSPKVAVAQVKRYLSDPQYSIAVHDLVTNEVAAVRERTSNAHFPTSNENPTAETTQARLKRYESALDLLLPELVCIGYWAGQKENELVAQSFRRAAEESDTPEGGVDAWISLKRYPALLLLYGIGMAAIAHGNYSLVKSIFDLKILKKNYSGEKRVSVLLHDQAVMKHDHQPLLLGRKEHTPLSNYLFDKLRETMRSYLPREDEYERTFLWFEYFRALASLDALLSPEKAEGYVFYDESSDPHNYWFPMNRFGWTNIDLAPIAEVEIPKAIEAQFFGGDSDQGYKKYSALRELSKRVIRQFRDAGGILF
jgi:hypothetical protein